MWPEAYLWFKALHIVFVTSWFAGLFYLPRVYVNIALVDGGVPARPDASAANTDAERARLLLMARKLYRFMGPLMLLALGFGLVLWLGYGVGLGAGSGWMHAKLAIVVLLAGYHGWCGRLLRGFEAGPTGRSHVWFRWFNEAPVIALLVVTVLVVVKPF